MSRPWGSLERKNYFGMAMWSMLTCMLVAALVLILFKSSKNNVAPMASEPEKCRFYSDEVALYHRCELNDNCVMSVLDIRRQGQAEMGKKFHCDLAGPEDSWPQ